MSNSLDPYQAQHFVRIPSKCLTVRMQMRPEVLGLTWVESVCKDYQQMKLAGKELLKCHLKSR